MSRISSHRLNVASLHSQFSTGSELLDTFSQTAPQPHQGTAIFDYANSEKLGLQAMEISTWRETSTQETSVKTSIRQPQSDDHTISYPETTQKDPGSAKSKRRAVERLSRTLKNDRKEAKFQRLHSKG